MDALRPPCAGATLYVASRLPELSETFVYRELFGLRARGRTVLGASIRAPRRVADDPAMAALAAEVAVVYGARSWLAMPIALARHPLASLQAIGDALCADHTGPASRLKHLFQAMMGITLAWRLRDRGITHVHAHMAHVPTTVGLYAARTLGARFSFTGHAADLFVQRAGLRFKLDQAAFVSCISAWHQQFYHAITSLDQARLPLIRCSVALPDDLRERHHEVVTVARLVPKKGIDLLIRAFTAAALPGWRLRILGDGPERESLERLARDIGIDQSVTFEGAKPHKDCLEAIGGAGMFVLPCRTAANGDKDGIPVVLMEAMAASRAVIGGDLPTIRELITDGQTGLLVRPNEEEGLVAAMRQIASDDGLAGSLGTNARRHIEREFSDRVNLDRLCAAFDHAAATA